MEKKLELSPLEGLKFSKNYHELPVTFSSFLENERPKIDHTQRETKSIMFWEFKKILLVSGVGVGNMGCLGVE